MSDRTPASEFQAAPVIAEVPAWARSMRLTKEQLAAAERTRDFHVRKLESRFGSGERANESSSRSEH